MKRLLRVLPVVALALSCDDVKPTPTPPNPPQAFITVNEANVIGGEIRGKVNVSGCKNIAGLELLESDSVLKNIGNPDGGTKTPVDFSLSPGSFSHLYARRGIATPLVLKARVTCDDARTNSSQPVGVKFFPVASRISATTPGEQAVHDSFIAEGGVGGTPVSFLGCALTNQGGTTIARVDAQANLLGYATALPFDCDGKTIITDKSMSTGTRWVLQPGEGVYAIDQSLNVVFHRAGNAQRIGAGKGGSALAWFDEAGSQQRVECLHPVLGIRWSYGTGGIMNSTPLVDDEGMNRTVWFSQWFDEIGTNKSQTVVYKMDLLTGQLLNPLGMTQNPSVLFQQTHSNAEIDIKLRPEGTFNSDGSLYMLPLNSYTNGGVISTTIVSCPTTGALCSPSSNRWYSQTFPTRLAAIIPFSEGNLIAVLGPFAVYFLDAQTGAVRNLGERPLQPSGSNIVVAAQPGLGSDFYVLTGPNFGDNVASYPNEIIAVDSPASGELWRMEYGSGENSVTGVTMGIDDARNVWLRVGVDLVKPLTNAEYRMARGPTSLP